MGEDHLLEGPAALSRTPSQRAVRFCVRMTPSTAFLEPRVKFRPPPILLSHQQSAALQRLSAALRSSYSYRNHGEAQVVSTSFVTYFIF